MAAFKNIKGLVALVTGAASGLGRATAERLVKQGAKVVICDLPTSRGESVAEELGTDCVFVPSDVTSESDIQNVIAVTAKNFGKLDVAVSCAARHAAHKVFSQVSGLHFDLVDFNRMISVNTMGTFNVARLAAGLMSKNAPDENGNRGVIINTSGISAFEGSLGQSAYAASAGGIISMTLPISRDLAGDGIRCCAIATGYFDTPLLRGLDQKIFSFVAETTLAERLGEPEEFAHAVQMIIENQYLNGAIVRLDGGTRLD